MMHRPLAPLLLVLAALGSGAAASVLDEAGPTAQVAELSLSINQLITQGEFQAFHIGAFEPREPILLLTAVNNNSDFPVQFVGINTGCECTGSDLPTLPLAPGEVAVIPLLFDLTGRSGSYEQTITLQISAEEESETVGFITRLDLRTMARLDAEGFNIHVFTQSDERTVFDETLGLEADRQHMPVGVAAWELEALLPPPPGIALLWGGPLPLSDSVHLTINTGQLAQVPDEIALPLEITLLDAEGQAIERVRQRLLFSITSGLDLVTDPGDLFLGVVRDRDFPLTLDLLAGLHPSLEFRPTTRHGRWQDTVWSAESASGEEYSEQWRFSVTVERPSSVGSNAVSIPVSVEFPEPVGLPDEVFPLIIQYVLLPGGRD